MKTNLTILSILIAGTLATTAAQSGPMTVKLFSTDSTSSANGPQTTALVLSFTGDGKDSLDMYDMGNLGMVTSSRDFSSPFTLSSEGEILTMVDHRNVLTGPHSIPFGMYTKNAATISLTANAYYSSPNPGDTVLNTELGNIYIQDLTSNLYYDIKDTTASINIPVNTIPTADYVLHFFPVMSFVTTDETCYEAHNGTFHVTNPGMTSWELQITNPMGSITTIPVYQADTTIAMLMPGTYTVKSLFNGLLTDQQTVNIYHHAPVLPTFNASATTETQLTSILFTNISSDPSLTWSWDMGDGNTFSTADVTHSYISTGTYTVVLSATDDAGCTGNITETIQITAGSFAPPSFNNPDAPIGRNNTENQDPTMSQRDGNTIVITQNGEVNPSLIEVYTINGQHVASEKPASNVTEINVPNGGCYIVMMTMPNGEVKTERIVLGL